ncbi:MAG: helix-turn-helix domain-containing protein [Gammaproteobacteria bacterium]|nr:helix-turn-helix domain-containing protein [Gammaproteobacteria bacterium]NIR88955.1 helix-turn-helix domain-containing protein [Gammaproteobacteria bacterium]NIU05244.1 helix-turn-helix domain-containing protein [Gammaproteobacteria bacterium]NIV52859.1 MerR family DNA-binding protein [Gammaproteobacteria bacterium]NIW85155.1 MerR family DNA-binding protein [Gammaproteobacteria bacterium]
MPSEKGRFSIGALSGRSGVNVETIRYYERIGLLPDPPRTEGGHRLYGLEHVKRLAFIRRSRELGFSIEEIRALLDLVDSGAYTCGEVKSMTDRHLESVRSKIADLRKLERTLAGISSQCEGGEVPECPVIDALSDD